MGGRARALPLTLAGLALLAGWRRYVGPGPVALLRAILEPGVFKAWDAALRTRARQVNHSTVNGRDAMRTVDVLLLQHARRLPCQ